MKNMQISGTGNSRFMKSAISETETWEGFLSMLRAGTFPFDFNGINDAGVTEKGTPYDVDNVLKDSTAALLGGDASMVPDEAFVALSVSLDRLDALVGTKAKIAAGSYAGTNATNYTRTITLGFEPKFMMISSNQLEVSRDGSKGFVLWHEGVTQFSVIDGYYNNYSASLTFTQLGTGLQIRNTSVNSDDDKRVMNFSGKTYYYIAIG